MAWKLIVKSKRCLKIVKSAEKRHNKNDKIPPSVPIIFAATEGSFCKVYGSSRLGLSEVGRNLLGEFSGGDKFTMYKGSKLYELTNHLGNVLSVVSDELDSNGEAIILSAKDYYPFGMSMPGRVTEGGSYRYGFNGKETDPETDIQDYGMRWYLPNIARFPSVDPITKEYPELTPFQFAGNMPIRAIDLDGLEPEDAVMEKPTKTVAKTSPITYEERVYQKPTPTEPPRTLWLRATKGVGLIFGFMLMPANSSTPAGQDQPLRVYAVSKPIEIVTNDPSTLSDDYLRQVQERIFEGKALPNDQKYLQEAEKRFGQFGYNSYISKDGLPDVRWIQRDTWKDLKILKIQEQVKRAMDKGMAPTREGSTGIIRLNDDEKKQYPGYTHKIKILTKGGSHNRVFGKIINNSKGKPTMIFDKIINN